MSPKAAMYHLTDFKIDEVSLVDHAANKRRFVILKRENPMPDEPTPEVPVSSEPVASGDTSPPAGDTHDASPQSSKSVATEDLAATNDSLQEDITELKAMVARLAAQASEEKASSVPSQDADAVAVLTKRIARIEKNVGLPASAGATPVAPTAIHTWPFDINHTSKEQ